MLLPEGGVDLEVRRPKFLLGVVGRGIFEVGDRQALAGGAVPGSTLAAVAPRKRHALLLEHCGKFSAGSAAIGALVQLILDCLRLPAHS
jgi:hypothetical protein